MQRSFSKHLEIENNENIKATQFKKGQEGLKDKLNHFYGKSLIIKGKKHLKNS